LARALQEDEDGVGRRFFPFSPFRFRPGELTDDTQMAWAASCELRAELPDLTQTEGRLAYLRRVGSAYRDWYRSAPPDVGGATSDSLRIDSIDGGWQSWAGGEAAGNGSLMRATAPYSDYDSAVPY
jgi:ADP-ribosylglycohydrolase